MKQLVVVLSGFCLAGCRAFDPALLHATPEPLAVRLPRLTAQVHRPGFCTHLDSQAVARDLDTLFAREVRTVLTSPAGPSHGYAVLTTRCVRYGQGGGFTYLSGLTLGGLTLVGFPWCRYHATVEVQLDVRNQRRELVGTYYAQGQAVLLGGLYRRTNYTPRDYNRILYLHCVRQGLAQIVCQLPPDLGALQQQLLP